MTPDLGYLAWTALLTGLLWIPYIAGQVMTNGFLSAENYRDPASRPVPLWAQRANRAHLNAVEVFAPFAALVLVAHATGQSNATTAMWAAIFFWSRVAHALVYYFAVPFVRTLVFAVGTVAIVGLFWEVIN